MPSFRDIYERMGGFRRREFRDQLESRGHSLGEHFYGAHDCADGIQDSGIRREAEYAYDELKGEERREEERREQEERDRREQERQAQAAQERRWEEERRQAEFLEEQRYEDERRDQEALEDQARAEAEALAAEVGDGG